MREKKSGIKGAGSDFVAKPWKILRMGGKLVNKMLQNPAWSQFFLPCFGAASPIVLLIEGVSDIDHFFTLDGGKKLYVVVGQCCLTLNRGSHCCFLPGDG